MLYYDSILLRHVATNQIIATLIHEKNPVFSPDGTMLATETLESDEVRLRKIETRQLIGKFQGEGAPAFNHNGTMLATNVRNDTSDCFDICVRNIATKQLITVLQEERNPFFSPDGKLLASHNMQLDQIYLHNAATGHRIGSFQGVENKVFSPDSTILATDPELRDTNLYDTTTGRLIVTFEENAQPVFSPDNTMLALRSQDCTMIYAVDFRHDLATIEDAHERILLLNAAHKWSKKEAYNIKANDPVYQGLIKKLAYLNNSLLFDTQEPAEEKPEDDSCSIL